MTKFGKVSVFSDLNNSEDISMDNRYADICGITERRNRMFDSEDVPELGRLNAMTKEEECYARLKENYDGYHFETGTLGIYNPFSLLNTLKSKKFGDYWF